MPAPWIPWEPCNIPEEVQAELNRRKGNRSFNYIKAEQEGWGGTSGEWTKYKGPMSPWVRFCSNGIGSEVDKNNIKPGFVFFSGKDFYSGYGFKKDRQGIIGYMPDSGDPHIIENDLNQNYPVHVPPPEIERVSLSIQREIFRKATVDWVCFSKKQLEYMTPYFLVPGISCILEWGWNHYNPLSLLPLNDKQKLKEYFNNPYPLYTKHILGSNGNYDVLMGIITNFEWSVDGNKIRCKTEVCSQDRIYAGLILDASGMEKMRTDAEAKKNNPKKADEKPLGNLPEFLERAAPQLKEIATKEPMSIPELKPFMEYLFRNQKNWKDYAYGVYWGRDPESLSAASRYDNKSYDFDRKANYKNLWISMGLLMEIINYNASICDKFNQKEVFRCDIDDVVISAHPNLISCDGSTLLIPNSEAPHYHYGEYGAKVNDASEQRELAEYSSTSTSNFGDISMPGEFNYADARVKNITKAESCLRDDHDIIINHWRKTKAGRKKTEFPFKADEEVEGVDQPYPRRFSGYLKNLYFNYHILQLLVKRHSGIRTYPDLIRRILEEISKCAGNFWSLSLISATGKKFLSPNEPAYMKVCDNRFMATINRGKVYIFDYMDADSLLLNITFKPTLSNAQAIAVMYSETNNPNRKVPITNGETELLDYKYRDRLRVDDEKKGTDSSNKEISKSYISTMTSLQAYKPKGGEGGSYQVSTEINGKKVILRLALPAPEILKMLLDDGDEEHNPKYTGIMPGIQSQFTIQGIGGIRTFMMFLVRNFPSPYSHENVVFRVTDIQDTIENGKWTTTLICGLIPLRDYIKKRLGIKIEGPSSAGIGSLTRVK